MLIPTSLIHDCMKLYDCVVENEFFDTNIMLDLEFESESSIYFTHSFIYLTDFLYRKAFPPNTRMWGLLSPWRQFWCA